MSDTKDGGTQFPEVRELKQDQREAPLETREGYSPTSIGFEPTSDEDAPNVEHVPYIEPAGLADVKADPADGRYEDEGDEPGPSLTFGPRDDTGDPTDDMPEGDSPYPDTYEDANDSTTAAESDEAPPYARP